MCYITQQTENMRKLLGIEVLHAKNTNRLKKGLAKTKKKNLQLVREVEMFGVCLNCFELAS